MLISGFRSTVRLSYVTLLYLWEVLPIIGLFALVVISCGGIAFAITAGLLVLLEPSMPTEAVMITVLVLAVVVGSLIGLWLVMTVPTDSHRI
jgi:uncharacterized membrane protein (DUF106 family)